MGAGFANAQMYAKFSLAACLVVMIFLGNLAFVLSSDGYVLSKAASYATPALASSNVAPEIASAASADVLAFVKGESSTLSYASLFRPGEISHLSDVRSRLMLSYLALYVSVALAAVSLLILFLASGSLGKFLLVLRQFFFWSGIAALVLVGFAFILSMSFDSSFSAFHKIVFGSSQWAFPSDYLLVNLFTGSFFSAMAFDVFVGVLINAVLLIIVAAAIGAFWSLKYSAGVRQ